jgi:hypothetical protein
MKKTLLILLVFTIILLSGCRRSFLDAPDEMEVPSGSKVAVCDDTIHVYKFVYQNDGVYLYYIDEELQDINVTDTIQEQAYLHGESVENYLQATFSVSQCVIDDYTE